MAPHHVSYEASQGHSIDIDLDNVVAQTKLFPELCNLHGVLQTLML